VRIALRVLFAKICLRERLQEHSGRPLAKLRDLDAAVDERIHAGLQHIHAIRHNTNPLLTVGIASVWVGAVSHLLVRATPVKTLRAALITATVSSVLLYPDFIAEKLPDFAPQAKEIESTEAQKK